MIGNISSEFEWHSFYYIYKISNQLLTLEWLCRKKFGIQFFLDVIRQHYAVADRLDEEDAQAVRVALMEIIKYYIHKDLNIKEVCIIVSYIASVHHEYLIVELLELIWTQMNSKNCLDQLFLLLHEPQTAELCYALLTDRKYSTRLHLTALKVSIHALLKLKSILIDFFSLNFSSWSVYWALNVFRRSINGLYDYTIRRLVVKLCIPDWYHTWFRWTSIRISF